MIDFINTAARELHQAALILQMIAHEFGRDVIAGTAMGLFLLAVCVLAAAI